MILDDVKFIFFGLVALIKLEVEIYELSVNTRLVLLFYFLKAGYKIVEFFF